jgi:hypothetical protein
VAADVHGVAFAGKRGSWELGVCEPVQVYVAMCSPNVPVYDLSRSKHEICTQIARLHISHFS